MTFCRRRHEIIATNTMWSIWAPTWRHADQFFIVKQRRTVMLSDHIDVFSSTPRNPCKKYNAEHLDMVVLSSTPRNPYKKILRGASRRRPGDMSFDYLCKQPMKIYASFDVCRPRRQIVATNIMRSISAPTWRNVALASAPVNT